MNIINKKLWGILFSGVLIMLFVGAASAQPLDEGPESGHEKRMGIHGQMKEPFAEMFEKLGLTQEQKDKLKSNREQHLQEREALRKQVNDKREEIRNALDAADLNMANVTKIHNEFKLLMAKMEDERLAAILGIRQVLTPEQFKKFQEMAPHKRFLHKKKGMAEKMDDNK